MANTPSTRTTVHERSWRKSTGEESCQMTTGYGMRCYAIASYLINPVSGSIHVVYACRHHLASALDAVGRSAVSPLTGK